MNKDKKTLIIGFTFIAVVVLSVVGLTYAFFTAEVFGNNNASSTIVKTGDLKLVYTFSQELKIDGALPGAYAERTFTVENAGSHAVEYTIVIEDLVNTFVGGELVYTLSNDAGLNIEEEKVPTEEESNELVTTAIKSGEVHTYTVKVTFKETGENQNSNQGAIFTGKLQIKTEETYAASSGVDVVALYVDNKRVNKLDDNKVYKLDIENSHCNNRETIEWNSAKRSFIIYPLKKNTSCQVYFKEITNLYEIVTNTEIPQSDASINFGAISSSANGTGLYYTSDLTETEDTDGDGEGEVVYYYRGEVENNYVIFGGYCWRIVRTNENGSIKLRYGGVPIDEMCPETGIAVNIGTSQYNQAMAVDYKTSDIKKIVENWYEINMWKNGQNIEVTDLIEDTPYCSDMSGSENSYGTRTRLYINNPPTPQYKCADDIYAYTVKSGKLEYPIALLTGDEVAYAGGKFGVDNRKYYLYTGEDYWTMSPHYFAGSTAYVFYVTNSGDLTSSGNKVDLLRTVVPVISLKAETEVSSGTGVFDNPYVIKTN